MKRTHCVNHFIRPVSRKVHEVWENNYKTITRHRKETQGSDLTLGTSCHLHQEETEITISQLSLESFSSRTIFKPGGSILCYICSDSHILILGSTSAGVAGFVCFGPVVFNVSNQGLWQRQSEDEGSKDNEDTGKVQHEGHHPWLFCPLQHHFQ